MKNSSDIIESIDLGFGVVALRKDSILTFTPITTTDTVSLSELKTLLETLIKVSNGKPRPFYCDNTYVTKMGFSERKFIGDNLHLFATASAVKHISPTTRFIGHTILSMFPPKVPMQMFPTEDDAMNWLHGLHK